MNKVLVDKNTLVKFEDANNYLPQARLYKRVPFLFWSRWEYVASSFYHSGSWILLSKDQVIKRLIESAACLDELQKERNEFNRS